MTEPGGALAGLRQAIDDHVQAQVDVRRWTVKKSATAKEADAALDAKLAAVEARLGRLVRFVRADDEISSMHSSAPLDEVVYLQAIAEKRTARAAITKADLT